MIYPWDNRVPPFLNSEGVRGPNPDPRSQPPPPRYPTEDSGFTGLERRICELYNDPLVQKSTIGPNRVFCLGCGKRVEGLGTAYVWGRWEYHRDHTCEAAKKAVKKLNEGKPFVPSKTMEGLSTDDRIVSAEEQRTKEGMYSKRMIQWRKMYEADIQKETEMAQGQVQSSAVGIYWTVPQVVQPPQSYPALPLFVGRTLPPLPNRQAIPKDLYENGACYRGRPC